MTRGMFFKMLATLGLGQSSGTLICDTGTLHCEVICKEKEGEERCPLGHCQKPSAYLEPKPIWGHDDKAPDREGTEMTGMTWAYYEPGKWVAPRVCSTCGIVYVQPRKGRG